MKRKASRSGRGSRLRLSIFFATVTAFLLVPVAQAAAAPTSTVQITGTGSGQVFSYTPESEFAPKEGSSTGTPPIECSYTSPGPATGVCENEVEPVESPPKTGLEHLYAYPSSGSEFVEWVIEEGEGTAVCNSQFYVEIFSSSGASGICWLNTLEEEGKENIKVTAVFNAEPTPNLKLNIEEGSGTVVSNPAGLECSGSAPKSCEAAVAEGSVTLTASPAPGYAFKSWKKCDTGGVNGRQCTITAGASLKEIGAKFVKTWNLDVSKAGSGTGKAQTSPGGVLCLYNCQSAEAAFKEGSVTIKQAAAKHNHFVQWLGDCTGSAETCVLSMNEDHSVEAEFAPDTQYTLSISKEGGGQASIKSSPSGLLCGYTCGSQTASFYSGETVSIAVTLNKGTTALEWTTSAGTCTGNALTCTVPMSAAKSLVAKLS